MNTIKTTLLIAVTALTLGACGPTLSPFTQRMYEENQWTASDLKRIQFYLSDDIVLRREASGGSSEIIAGEIKIVDGREVEEVVIRKGTPGVFLFHPKEKHFALGFEEGKDQRFLIFGPNPKTGGRYVLLASKWQRRHGKVTYGERKYQVEASSAYSSLLVDLKKIRKTSVKSSIAGGRKVAISMKN